MRSELESMRRRVGQRVRRMTVEDCQEWWDAYSEASLSGNLERTGELTSQITGMSEPSRSQNIRGYVKGKVYGKLRKAGKTRF